MATQTENYGLKKPAYTDAADISVINENMDIIDTKLKEIDGAIDEVFQSVSSGKELIASAITDKGVSTLATDTFQTMASNIAQIEGGGGELKNIGNLKDGVPANFTFGLTRTSWSQYIESAYVMEFDFTANGIVSKWKGGSQVSSLLVANVSIDVSYLNTIKMKVSTTSCYGSNLPLSITINPTRVEDYYAFNQSFTRKTEVYGNVGDTELVIDVSDLGGEYYIHIFSIGYSCTITDLILE